MATEEHRTLSAPDRRYSALVDRIATACQQVEGANLRRYHKIGSLFSEFVRGLDSRRYGSATVERLAEDLQERGILAEVTRPTRLLYWAKNISDAYEEAQLDALAERGFTVSHAKQLFALTPELRQEVEKRMIVDGQVVATRNLALLVTEANQKLVSHASQEAATAAATERQSREEGTSGADTTEAEAPTAPQDQSEVPEGAQAEIADDAQAPVEANPRQQAPAAPRERTVSNPLKVIRDLEKYLTKVNLSIPDAFIVVRESGQIGFDSDVAHNRYITQLRNARVAANGLIEPLQELLNTINAELEGSDGTAET